MIKSCAADLSTCEYVRKELGGMAAFQRIVPQNLCIEIARVWYVPEVQKTHVNTETIHLLLREAIDRLGYRRVEWKCDALNERSRQAALRLGFQFEGIFRQHMIVKGRSRDTAWFAMTGGDWAQVKQDLRPTRTGPTRTGRARPGR